jgi:hypothetical protein
MHHFIYYFILCICIIRSCDSSVPFMLYVFDTLDDGR